MSSRVDLHVPFAEKDQVRELGGRWDKGKKIWYVPEGMDSAPFSLWLEERPQETSMRDSSPFDSRGRIEASTSSLTFAARSAINVRADFYYVAEVNRRCWRCKATAPVFSFFLPKSYESLALMDPMERADADNHENLQRGLDLNTIFSFNDYLAWLNGPDSTNWISQQTEAVPFHIHYLSSAVMNTMRALAPTFRKERLRKGDIDDDAAGRERFWHNTCSQCKTRIDDTRKDSSVCSHLPRSSTEASYYLLHPVAEPFEAGAKGLATGIEFLRYMQIKN